LCARQSGVRAGVSLGVSRSGNAPQLEPHATNATNEEKP
jgi:hypothetical protein